MAKTLTDWLTKKQTTFHEEADGVLIEQATDVTDVIEEAKTLYNSHSHKATQKFAGDGFHHVASIPMAVMTEYKRRTGVDLMRCTEEELRRFLNDRDHLMFRTKPGRL